ncbi:hypothetical protein [Pontiella agarivorans]|uniref:DUF423 domain-containing protein n=1 Tax=Pontiella agarivorans TaxID=3038953 RepID=A0ABU5MW06_9BACT|nr:hypothetical protein [Pontiella agarivorans]MDZ8118414.1 hypothetical protein [Pontiella agarivorans]
MINITAAWIGFALGAVSGAIPGLFFHRPDWLGGYTSWPRRLIRLAHISFFGIGFLNLGLGLTARALDLNPGASSVLMMAGAVMMPTVCYLSAFKPAFRHLFFIPAGAVLIAIILFIIHVDGASSSVMHSQQESPISTTKLEASSTFQKGATP